MQPIVQAIGKFTIAVTSTSEHGASYRIGISPGMLKFKSHDGTQVIRNKECVFFLHDYDSAMWQYRDFIKYASEQKDNEVNL